MTTTIPAADLAGTRSPSEVSAVPGFVRILVHGRDRARFIHNFTTNHVKALTPGKACEVFFTDIKARILSHGWVLAAADHLELWMLAADSAAIMAHLDRYIITDDVSLTDETARVRGALTWLAAADPSLREQPPLTWHAVPVENTSGPLLCLNLEWAGFPVQLQCHSTPTSATHDARSSPELSGQSERLRILERMPLWGIDVTSDNLAPEADRNRSAISYAKGCYLGQEPIARLDALGHLNRRLTCLVIDASPSDCVGHTVRCNDMELGQITSACPSAIPGRSLALAILRRTAENNAAPLKAGPVNAPGTAVVFA